MANVNLKNFLLNGVLIKEEYSGEIESKRGGIYSMTKKYILRKKGTNADARWSKTQQMNNDEAYACLHSFILQFQPLLEYPLNEYTVFLWVTQMRVTVEKNEYPVFRGTVTWETPDPRKPHYIVNPVTWSHRMTGGTRKVTYPISQKAYTLPGIPRIHYPGVNWNAGKDGAMGSFDGVECYSPEWTMVAKQQILASLVTPAYLRMLMSVSKTVNSQEFRGFYPGTVLYLGADTEEGTIAINDKEWKICDITHQFVVEPNLAPFTYEGVAVTDGKLGHEYLWCSTFLTPDGMRVSQVNIAQMYNYSNFYVLGLGT